MSGEKTELPIGAELDTAVARVLGYTDVETAHGVQLPIDPSERVSVGSVEIVYAGAPEFSTDPGAQGEMLDWLEQRHTPPGQVEMCWYVDLKRWAVRYGWQGRPHSNWTTAAGATINEALARLVLAVASR